MLQSHLDLHRMRRAGNRLAVLINSPRHRCAVETYTVCRLHVFTQRLVQVHNRHREMEVSPCGS